MYSSGIPGFRGELGPDPCRSSWIRRESDATDTVVIGCTVRTCWHHSLAIALGLIFTSGQLEEFQVQYLRVYSISISNSILYSGTSTSDKDEDEDDRERSDHEAVFPDIDTSMHM